MKQALAIAGSDSGSGAGLQADLKTFHAHGVYGLSVVTAVTAQNTVEISTSEELSADIVRAQLASVFADFTVAAVKTGMLSSSVIIDVIAAAIVEHGVDRLVVDPVLLSKSGYTMLRDDAHGALVEKLLPLAHVVTPNLHEAEQLSGIEIRGGEDMKAAAECIHGLGCRNVLIKGGHAKFDRATDILFDGKTVHEFRGEFIDTRHTHGIGCTFSAAITARLALGEPLIEAIDHAKRFVTKALKSPLDIGRGQGPVNSLNIQPPRDD